MMDAQPPELRAAAKAAIARDADRRASPEGREQEQEIIRRIRQEFPPLPGATPS
jgi:hypothetical protein